MSKPPHQGSLCAMIIWSTDSPDPAAAAVWGLHLCLWREGDGDHGFWNKVLVTATSSICDGLFYVSTWLGCDVQVCHQTLFCKKNREPSNKPVHLWSINVQQRSHEYTMGKEQSSGNGVEKIEQPREKD